MKTVGSGAHCGSDVSAGAGCPLASQHSSGIFSPIGAAPRGTFLVGLAMRASEPTHLAPGPPGELLLGHVRAFQLAPLEFLLEARRNHGDVVRLRAGFKPAFLLAHPDHVQHVLQTAATRYPKGTRVLDRVGRVLGRGLVNSEGQLWRQQRRLIQPAFHAGRLADYLATIVGLAEETAARWSRLARQGTPVDIAAEMMGLAFRIVGRALLGVDLTDDTDPVRRAVSTLEADAHKHLAHPFAAPTWLPTKANRRFHEALRVLDVMVYDLIAAHTTGQHAASSVLSALAGSQSGGGDVRQIRDEIVTLLLAGHENTGNALSWMWALMAQHSDIADRVRDEALQAAGRGPITWEALASLQLCRRVVEETLRLYPTAWLSLRRAAAADSIGGYTVPRGSWILICPVVVHRHPGVWPDPERFDPERFTPERTRHRHRFAYLPFGAGPRKCPGASFAVLESTVILATLARRFRLQLVRPESVRPAPSVSLPPVGGLPAYILPVTDP